MQIGLIGLGRMGGGIAQRLLRDDHAVVAFDRSPAQVDAIARTGAVGARSLQDVVGQLAAPRAVWVMVPHGEPTRQVVEELLPMLTPDDVIVDGGNSHFAGSMHAAGCGERGVHVLDVGVSGGVWGIFTK